LSPAFVSGHPVKLHCISKLCNINIICQKLTGKLTVICNC